MQGPAMNGKTAVEANVREGTGQIRLLLLEDSLADLELIQLELRASGFPAQFTHADGKEKFLQLLEEEEFDAIISDFRLPNWTGLAALSEVRAARKDGPFLLVTGTMGEEAAVECIKQGVSDFVLKEHIGRLPEALRRALREKELQREAMRAHEALEESELRVREQFAELDM